MDILIIIITYYLRSIKYNIIKYMFKGPELEEHFFEENINETDEIFNEEL